MSNPPPPKKKPIAKCKNKTPKRIAKLCTKSRIILFILGGVICEVRTYTDTVFYRRST